jgi:Trk-type K+ transport system membrane component
MVGRILQLESGIFLIPLIISLVYRETFNVLAFVVASVIALVLGLLLTYVLGKNDKMIFAKEGFAIVAIA